MNHPLEFNLFNIIIISATVHGIIFSAFIFFSKNHRTTATFCLAQLVFYLSMSNLYYWFIDTKIIFGWEPYRYLFVPWEVLILPAFYFFVCTYLGKKIRYRKFLLFPFYLLLVAQILLDLYRLLFATSEEGRNMSNMLIQYGEYVTPVFSVAAIYLTLREIHRYEREKKNTSEQEIQVETRWLKGLLYTGIAVCGVLFFYIFLKLFILTSIYELEYIYYFVWIGMSIIIYWLGYAGVYHVGIFNQRRELRKKLSTISDNQEKKKYSIKRFEELDSVIKRERLYANPNCGLTSLAEHFQISEGYLSQLINNFSGYNSSTYINNLRLIETQRMLQSEEFADYTIVSLGLEAGFNSKSTFYNAFKKQYDISPSAFRKSRIKKSDE